MSRFLRAYCALAAAVAAYPAPAFAQSATTLPTIDVTEPSQRRAAAPRPAPVTRSVPVEAAPVTQGEPQRGSLTVPSVQEARTEIQKTPGAVAIVPSEALKDRNVTTIKDVLDFVPGVFAQPKWGEDTRLSIRGSGLSRNFHGRGIQLYMDGIPINTADGYFDFQEIDPSAYRYTEVFRGGNALRFGANSLGGAINFVVPSGRDASPFAISTDVGSFGYRRIQASSGGASGPFDYFVTGSYQLQDGFRDHSNGHSQRGSANFGYQITPNVETRFYFNGNTIEQHIPGAVTKFNALNNPRGAALGNVNNDYQRNINSNRFANKTTFKLDNTIVEVGAFSTNRHLMHPIFQWIDSTVEEYGVFGRMVDERNLWGFKNRLVAGVNVHNGENNNLRFGNGPLATKGALTFSALETSKNTSAYAENSFYFIPNVALVTGTQFLQASRDSRDRFLSNGDQSGRTDFDLWSPKFGLLWDIAPSAQAFANVSRSAEVPSFGESSTALSIPFTQIKPQRATTYEIGTRGQQPDYTWDFALYRAQIKNELQCFNTAPGSCDVLNADRTIHQGVEAGFGVAVLKSIFTYGANADRLWVNLAYTLNDFHYDNDIAFGDNVLPGAPRHYLRGELIYKHPLGFYVGPTIEWVPDGYFVDAANLVSTDPYALWGLKAGFDNGKSFSVYVEGRNLADKAYIGSASIARFANANSALFEPGTGRAVYAGAKFKW